MESAVTPLGAAVPKQTSTRRSSSSIPLQDLWAATREGSIADLESALLVLKKNGGNIDARNTLGSTALHIAVWRNHVPVVRRLLTAGVDPNARDGESGWSSLHRALHFGHLALAGVLIEAGASLTLEDSRARTPVDLLSGPVQQQKKVAMTVIGELYTWGLGRGGRLGHPDFDIQSGQAAVITPHLVTCGLGLHRIKVIVAKKHHTTIATEGGEVFTWGSNREGQLGYTSVDTQSTPRRVSSLKTRVIAVAAANKHSTVVTEPGEVYTWGCNRDGQLGYGTSNSASNYIPRAVESLKGKRFVAVSAAKYHTVVLGADGEDLVLHNLDYILTVSASALANVSTELLAKLEKSLDAKSSEPWSYRHLPTPTATFPAIIDSEEDDSEIGFPRLRNISSVDASDQTTGERRSNDGFLHQTSAADRAMAKQVRAIRKKLQQIEILEMKQANGHSLDDQQRAKLQTKHSLENALTYLESGVATELREELSLAFSKPNVLDGNSISKGDLSRKRRCKDKKKSNRLASVQIGDLPETSDIETTLKTGLRKRPDESCSLKNFEDPDHSSYNAEGAGTKSGHQSVLSSFKKATLATSDDHGSDVILPCNQNVDMKNSSDHDLEVKTSLKGTQFTQKLAKKKSKKGGLSVFLSGALDDAPKVAAPAPVTPKVEGPAWGGARITKGPTSLLEIQSEQIVESNIPKTPESSRVTSKSISSGRHSLCESMRGSKALVDAYELDRDEGESSQIHIPLSQLVRTSAPIAVIPKKGTCASDAEKCTPPWAGTSPLTSRSSLREIQMQQVITNNNL